MAVDSCSGLKCFLQCKCVFFNFVFCTPRQTPGWSKEYFLQIMGSSQFVHSHKQLKQTIAFLTAQQHYCVAVNVSKHHYGKEDSVLFMHQSSASASHSVPDTLYEFQNILHSSKEWLSFSQCHTLPAVTFIENGLETFRPTSGFHRRKFTHSYHGNYST